MPQGLASRICGLIGAFAPTIALIRLALLSALLLASYLYICIVMVTQPNQQVQISMMRPFDLCWQQPQDNLEDNSSAPRSQVPDVALVPSLEGLHKGRR